MVGKYVNDLFARLKVPVEAIYLEPDGTFPNHEADPLKPGNLKDLSASGQEDRCCRWLLL